MSASSDPTDDALWQQVVQTYRQLCVHQRQPRDAASLNRLQAELTAHILDWADCVTVDGAAQARRLDEMFQAEQRHVADAWLAHELLEQRLRAELLPALTAHLSEEVRRAVTQFTSRPAPLAPAVAPPPIVAMPVSPAAAPRPTRVPAGDIPSIIDLILASEPRRTACPLSVPHPQSHTT